jgi:hypothetical protein
MQGRVADHHPSATASDKLVNYCVVILNFRSTGKRASTRAGSGKLTGRIRGARRFAALSRALIDKVKTGA